jgi:predicted SnoaL-like aldol condensation-catalyzing enzyme
MEQKRALVEKWFADLWGKRRAAIIDEMVAPDCISHGLPGVRPQGPAAFKPFFEMFCGAFSKVEVKIDHSIEQGDWIALRGTCTVTPPGGPSVSFPGGAMVRFNDKGQFIEAWNQWDFMTMLVGLKKLPADTVLTAVTKMAGA